jgi:hypothetical protein
MLSCHVITVGCGPCRGVHAVGFVPIWNVILLWLLYLLSADCGYWATEWLYCMWKQQCGYWKIRIPWCWYIYRILQSYLTNRYFRTKYRETYSSLRQLLAGVPQGSVLGTLRYLIYTIDLPTLTNSTTATFADGTAILTIREDTTMAAHRLQMQLNKIQSWLKTWRMKENEAKSVHVTFTLNQTTCPPVKLSLILPTWRIWWAPNARKWHMGFKFGKIMGMNESTFIQH